MKQIKKIFLGAVMLAMTSGAAFAQFYVGVGGGVNLNLLPNRNVGGEIMTIDTEGTEVPSKFAPNGDADLTSKTKYASLGSGYNIDLTVGYGLNDVLSVEGFFNYLIGRTVTFDETIVDNGSSSTSIFSQKSKSSFGTVGLGLRWQAPTEGMISPYARVFVTAPVFGSTTTSTQELDNLDFTEDDPTEANYSELLTEVKTKGGITLGIRTGAGVNISVSEMLDVYAEFNFNSLNIKAKSQEVTKLDNNTYLDGSLDNTVNGLDNMDEIQYKTNFVKTLDSSSNNPNYSSDIDNDKPLDELVGPGSAFGSFGFNVGVRINL